MTIRKSSYSNSNPDNACVGVDDELTAEGLISIVDTKNNPGPVLAVTPAVFGDLLRDVKNNEYELRRS